ERLAPSLGRPSSRQGTTWPSDAGAYAQPRQEPPKGSRGYPLQRSRRPTWKSADRGRDAGSCDAPFESGARSGIGVERDPKRVATAGQRRLDAAQRHVQGCGDLRHGKVEVVVEGDRGSLDRVEAPERALERVAIRRGDGCIQDRGAVQLRERDLEGMAAARPPQLIDARENDEPPQPRLELRRVAQTRQALPGSEQRLLDGVASEVGVPQRQP